MIGETGQSKGRTDIPRDHAIEAVDIFGAIFNTPINADYLLYVPCNTQLSLLTVKG
jgi:hypothetical protein